MFLIIPAEEERVRAYNVVAASNCERHSDTLEVWRGRLEDNIR